MNTDLFAFRTAQPIPHVVIDGFMPESTARAVAAEFPSPGDSRWVRYENAMERKLALPRPPGPLTRSICQQLNSEPFCSMLTAMTGLRMVGDDTLWGGGLHMIETGGKLDIHLDKSEHPQMHLERRLNLIWFVQPEWDESWGGEFELWNDDMTECVAKVAPLFNRCVIFELSDTSYHGHPEPLRTPAGVCRKSIATYYFCEPTGRQSVRKRAQFVARPCDDHSAEAEAMRAGRASGVVAQ